MLPQECIQGRWVDAGQIGWLRGWIQSNPQWSRKRIAKELCLQWEWRNQRGQLKDFAARSFLLKLESRGEILLPPLKVHNRRNWSKPKAPENWQEPSRLECSLKELFPLHLELVDPATRTATRWRFLIDQYHYLGLHVIGENVGYMITDRHGRELSCLLFAAAAWRCAPRDQWIGWKHEPTGQQLQRIANNTRFLIFPWVKVKGLASHILGKVAKRIDGDWRGKYGHGLEWLETFVETERFAGTCYKAANWKCVGETQGRGRQDRNNKHQAPLKSVYLYQLSR